MGSTIGGIKGDTRSVDYCSYCSCSSAGQDVSFNSARAAS